MSKVAFIDIDGTLLKGQSQQYFIKFLFSKGFIGFFDSVYIYAWFALYKLELVRDAAGILNFALGKFKGIDSAEIAALMDEFFESELATRLYHNASSMIEALNEKGFRTVLLSAAVEPIVSTVAAKLQAADFICTKVEVDQNGKYTGKLSDAHIYGNEKSRKAVQYMLDNALESEDLLAIADHESDKELLSIARYSFVANPKEGMRKWALEKNIPVIYLDEHEPVQYVVSHIESE
ncbi:MAG TPA: HAD-IB family hydrolase [Candidatus Paceibacterota bacterium]